MPFLECRFWSVLFGILPIFTRFWESLGLQKLQKIAKILVWTTFGTPLGSQNEFASILKQFLEIWDGFSNDFLGNFQIFSTDWWEEFNYEAFSIIWEIQPLRTSLWWLGRRGADQWMDGWMDGWRRPNHMRSQIGGPKATRPVSLQRLAGEFHSVAKHGPNTNFCDF